MLTSAACFGNILLIWHLVSALCGRGADKLDWYAQIRAYFDKEHPPFEYDFHRQRVARRRRS